MTLGEKIKAARLEAGLSQRQLCGNVITRNMLSQIENGSARPSMATLQHLARQLGKPIGYFLQEQAVDSPNPQRMAQAREAYSQRQYADALEILSGYQAPDPLFDQEWRYLYALCALARAEQCLGSSALEAATLLEGIRRDCIYYRPEQEQIRRQLLRRAYAALEEQYRQQQNFERAYFYACQLRQMQS